MTLCLQDAMREIGACIEAVPHVLLCLDFDGTLTPFVDDPAQAYLAPHMERVLRALSRKESVTVAVISGRDRTELQQHVGIPGLIYAGNHGLEISGPGAVFVEPTAAERSAPLKELAADLSRWLRDVPGAFVKDKGLTLSVHYRQVAPAAVPQVRRLVEAALAATEHPVHLTHGDMVFEIRPWVAWNKGAAVTWIKDNFWLPDALVIYLGADVTDEDAFADHEDGIMVKVGQGEENGAHFQLEGPAEVRRFLEWVDRHRR